MMEGLARTPMVDRDFAWELGRMAHLVCDLCQPLHTDGSRRGPDEARIHPRYERDVDRALGKGILDPVLLSTGLGRRASSSLGTPGTAPWVTQLISISNLDYDRVLDAYRTGQGFGDLEHTTERHLGRAVELTVALWIEAQRRRCPHEGPRTATWIPWLAAVLALVWWALRPVRPDERPVWPGRGSVDGRTQPR